MQEVNFSKILRCYCGGSIILENDATCDNCKQSYNYENKVLDLIENNSPQADRKKYHTELLSDRISSFYDLVVPAMSLGIWQCSPLRFLDHTHHALGQANHAFLLALPISTGSALQYALSNYHNINIVAVDSSLKMLKRAAKKFKHNKNIIFVRANPDALPFQNNTFRVVQSINGLYTFDHRGDVFDDIHRVLEKGGSFQGTTIIHGQNRATDFILDQYQNYGVIPPLRTIDFLMNEISTYGFKKPTFETHGAVAFFHTTRK